MGNGTSSSLNEFDLKELKSIHDELKLIQASLKNNQYAYGFGSDDIDFLEELYTDLEKLIKKIENSQGRENGKES